MKTAALILVSLFVGGALYSWLSGDGPPMAQRVEVVKEYIIAPPATPDPSEVLFTKASPAAVQSIAPTARANELGRRLLEAKDVKVFVIDALKHPEQGGAFYATLALRQCWSDGLADMKQTIDATIRQIVSTETTIGLRRMEAINASLTRCSGFSTGEVEALRRQAAEHVADDPLLALLSNVHKTRQGTPERAKARQAIYESGSAALISEAAVPTRFIQEATIEENGQLVVRFDGKRYGNDDMQAVHAGAILGTCVEGDFCYFDQQMLSDCRSAGACYSSRDEYVAKSWLKGDAAAYEMAKTIGDQVRSAIARKDRSIFQ